jgi:hypothetical protein
MNQIRIPLALPSIASAYHAASQAHEPAIRCRAAGEGIELTFTTAGSTKDHILKMVSEATQEDSLIRIPLTCVISETTLEQPVSCTLNLHVEPQMADSPYTVLITVESVKQSEVDNLKPMHTDTYEFTIEP